MNPRFAAFLRAALGVAVFAAAFISVSQAIHRALPLAEIPIVTDKLTHLAARHDEYDTLFIGSSRMHFQVVPRIFDEMTAAAGQATRSFNAGVAGMRPPEDAFFLDQILAHRPERLRWVFIELAGIRANIGADRRGTLRVQYWHDLPRLGVLWRHATQRQPTHKRWTPKRWWREVREPLGVFLPHVALFVREQINLGKGEFLTARWRNDPPRPRQALTEALGPDLAGWIPSGNGEEMSPAMTVEYDQELAERRAKPATQDFADRVSQETLAAMIAKIEAAGAQAVLVVPPTTSKKNFFPRPELARKSIVLDFSDPAKFPALYEHRHRLDTEHTNSLGSEVFTRLLVEQWLAARRASAGSGSAAAL